jgi:hypothetical protein
MEKIQESVLNYDTSLDNIYVGLEDIRLYSREDKLYYNANRGLGHSNIQVEYGEIDISTSSTKNNVILQRFMDIYSLYVTRSKSEREYFYKIIKHIQNINSFVKIVHLDFKYALAL